MGFQIADQSCYPSLARRDISESRTTVCRSIADFPRVLRSSGATRVPKITISQRTHDDDVRPGHRARDDERRTDERAKGVGRVRRERRGGKLWADEETVGKRARAWSNFPLGPPSETVRLSWAFYLRLDFLRLTLPARPSPPSPVFLLGITPGGPSAPL